MKIKVEYEHENVGRSIAEYDMRDYWRVSVNVVDQGDPGCVSSWATVVTPFDEINIRCHDWRVRKAARLIAKRLRVTGVTKRVLRPLLREAMFHGEMMFNI